VSSSSQSGKDGGGWPGDHINRFRESHNNYPSLDYRNSSIRLQVLRAFEYHGITLYRSCQCAWPLTIDCTFWTVWKQIMLWD